MELPSVTGEFYVAAELSRRGYISTLTMNNTRAIDIYMLRVALESTSGKIQDSIDLNKRGRTDPVLRKPVYPKGYPKGIAIFSIPP